MAEQSNEHQPLLNRSNDEEAESDQEHLPHILQREYSNSNGVSDPGNEEAPEEATPAILEAGVCVTGAVPAPVLYATPDSAPVLYTIPDESPPPYTPPTKVYNYPAEPPGYVTPPEGWKIEGLPTYNEEGRISLGAPRTVETPFGTVSEDVMSAICIMLFCCFPLGLLALIVEYQALKYHREGNHEKYMERKKFAKKLLFIGLTIGFVINCILILSLSN